MKLAYGIGTLLVFAAGCGACSSTPKLPSGPPPEYEEPPAPSWMADGGGAPKAAPSSVLDTILDQPPPAPAPAADGGGGPVPGM